MDTRTEWSHLWRDAVKMCKGKPFSMCIDQHHTRGNIDEISLEGEVIQFNVLITAKMLEFGRWCEVCEVHKITLPNIAHITTCANGAWFVTCKAWNGHMHITTTTI